MNINDIIRWGDEADDFADKKIGMPGEFHPDWHEVRDIAFAELVYEEVWESLKVRNEEISAYIEAAKVEQREKDAKLVKEMLEKQYPLDDFVQSIRAGMMRMCTDGRPFEVKVEMEVEAYAKELAADMYKRLYELRGEALARPCIKCGHKPAIILAKENV